MNKCRSGCPTPGAHASWAECARAAAPTIAATLTSRNREGYDMTRSELRGYEVARRNGVQPSGTSTQAVKDAMSATERLGRPYNANVDPPANLITTKKAAKFVNETSEA